MFPKQVTLYRDGLHPHAMMRYMLVENNAFWTTGVKPVMFSDGVLDHHPPLNGSRMVPDQADLMLDRNVDVVRHSFLNPSLFPIPETANGINH